MIEHLTPEQEAALHKYAQEWLAIGLATGETDKAIVEPIIIDLYQVAGLDKPKFVYAASPHAAQIMLNLLNPSLKNGCLEKNVIFEDTVYTGYVGVGIRGRVLDGSKESFRDSLKANVEKSLHRKIYGTIWDVVNNAVSGVAELVMGQLLDSLMDRGFTHYETSFWGNHDVTMLACELFYPEYITSDVYKPDELHRLNQWGQLARHCGWWYAFSDVCVVCDRPKTIHLDQQRRLHNLNGMAVEYSDGWEVYAINGVRVPADVVTHPELITVERILEEDNLEISRIMAEIYGEDRLMEHAKLIDDSDDPQTGSLWRFDFDNNDEPIVKLKLQNSTQNSDGSYKTYWVRVPPHFESAKAARAWTFYGNANNFNPSVET